MRAANTTECLLTKHDDTAGAAEARPPCKGEAQLRQQHAPSKSAVRDSFTRRSMRATRCRSAVASSSSCTLDSSLPAGKKKQAGRGRQAMSEDIAASCWQLAAPDEWRLPSHVQHQASCSPLLKTAAYRHHSRKRRHPGTRRQQQPAQHPQRGRQPQRHLPTHAGSPQLPGGQHGGAAAAGAAPPCPGPTARCSPTLRSKEAQHMLNIPCTAGPCDIQNPTRNAVPICRRSTPAASTQMPTCSRQRAAACALRLPSGCALLAVAVCCTRPVVAAAMLRMVPCGQQRQLHRPVLLVVLEEDACRAAHGWVGQLAAILKQGSTGQRQRFTH